MKTAPAAWIRNACHYILDKSINLYPPEQRVWGRAASAEVHAMPSSFSAVRWTHGALWVALRAWLGRLLRRPADALLGTHTLLRRGWPSLSPLLLALSLSFFLVPQFRQALQATTSMWIAGGPMPGLPDRTLRKLQAEAEREHDAQTLAFLAFHAKDRKDAIRLAGESVSLDPGLTWILGQFADWEGERTPAQWSEQLERWDPDNAIPYLLHADSLEVSAQTAEKKDQRKILDEMRTAGSPFRTLMQRAFAAPRYDSYLPRRLELERNVMRKHGLDRPLLLLEAFERSRLPNFFHAQTYARWIIADAKTGVRSEDTYRQVLRFGQLIEAHSKTVLEQIEGRALQEMGAKELVPLLRAQGHAGEADTLDYGLQRIQQSQRHSFYMEAALAPKYAPPYHPDPFNPGIIIHLAALLFVLFCLFLAVSLLFLRLSTTSDSTVSVIPRTISYAPLLVFSSALALIVAYLPYARIFEISMFGQQMARGVSPRPPSDTQLLESLSNLQYPFRFISGQDVWSVVGIGAALVLVLALYSIRRARAVAAHP
jgi:hypothetical protein